LTFAPPLEAPVVNPFEKESQLDKPDEMKKHKVYEE
jgi:hypothetical protein